MHMICASAAPAASATSSTDTTKTAPIGRIFFLLYFTSFSHEKPHKTLARGSPPFSHAHGGAFVQSLLAKPLTFSLLSSAAHHLRTCVRNVAIADEFAMNSRWLAEGVFSLSIMFDIIQMSDFLLHSKVANRLLAAWFLIH
jgi:hypothetical protein